MQNRSRHLAVLFPLAIAGIAAACGGSQPPAEAPAAPSAEPNIAPPAPTEPAPEPSASAAPAEAASAEPAEPAKPVWSDLKDEDAKKKFMKTTVLPHMKELFTNFDAKRFADMNCMTCHGKGVKEGKFDMPNPELPVLDPAGGFAKAKKKAPKMLEFMEQQVEPEMAKTLGLEPFNPETHSGFGCGNCHTFVGAKKAPAAKK